MSAQTRKYIYRVASAAFGLALIYGWVLVDQIPVWLLFIGAVLGVGTNELAVKNVSDPEPKHKREKMI